MTCIFNIYNIYDAFQFSIDISFYFLLNIFCNIETIFIKTFPKKKTPIGILSKDSNKLHFQKEI